MKDSPDPSGSGVYVFVCLFSESQCVCEANIIAVLNGENIVVLKGWEMKENNKWKKDSDNQYPERPRGHGTQRTRAGSRAGH